MDQNTHMGWWHPGRTGPSRRSVLTLFGAVGATTMMSGCGLMGDEEYPSRAIEYVVPYDPGGSTDPIGREFGRMLSEALAVKSVPLNLPGGDESIGITDVFRSDPDGLKIGLASSAGLSAQPLLNEDVPYDGPKDLSKIIKMVTVPYGLFVSGDSPFQTLEDFLDAAAERPGKIRVSSPNRFGGSAFTLYDLEESAGVETTIIPAPGGSGEASLAVMSGQTEAMVGTASGQLGLIEAGKMRALGYTGSGYEEFLPDTPSFESAGFDIPFAGDYTTIAPPGLPDDIFATLLLTAEEIAASDAWKGWCHSQAILPDALTGDDLVTYYEGLEKRTERAIAIGRSRLDN